MFTLILASALADAPDWNGDWIAPSQEATAKAPMHPPRMRHEFELAAPVKDAKLRVVGLGHFRIWVNGKPLGDAAFEQPWSQFDKRIYWTELDAKDALRAGKNVIAVQLGASYYSVPKPPPGRYHKGDAMPDFAHGRPYLLSIDGIARLANGATVPLRTTADWKWIPSPITMSHVQAGEDVDARLDQPGWSQPGFAEAGWMPVDKVAPPAAQLSPSTIPKMRVKNVFAPTRVLERGKGVWSYLFPQNCMGMVRFTVSGKPGAKVSFVPSEVVTPEGDVQQLNLWGARAAYEYTLRGGAKESRQAEFFYHGMQFIKVEGAVPEGQPNPEGLPVLHKLELIHVRVDNPVTGSFESSSDLYNRTEKLIDWAVKSNMSFVLSDCPHREKLGWLECAYLLAPTILYGYDCAPWYAKIDADIRDAQLPDGVVRTLAPFYLQRGVDDAFAFTVEWGAASVLVPWEAYRWTGDRAQLATSYASMRAYVDAIRARAKDGIAPQGLGDWYDYGHGEGPGPSRFTPTDLTSTACYAMCASAVADAAAALGKAEEAKAYRALHAEIGKAFWKRFWRSDSETLENTGSVQTANAMALEADVVPADLRAKLVGQIVAELEKRKYQQTSGDVGHVYLIRALAHAGRSDVLHRVYSRTGLGSYGGILAKGLTTMPETWDAMTAGSNSLNHAMLGHVVEWIYGYAAGLRQAKGSVGWQTIEIGPEPGAQTHASARTKIPGGFAEVSWKIRGSTLGIEAKAPKSSTVRFVLPAGAKSAKLAGKPVKTVERDGRLSFEAKGKSSYIVTVEMG
ncbi:MAG: family 78 glycoside hydrolase catalytic domain [Fimbriimonadales bacterium]